MKVIDPSFNFLAPLADTRLRFFKFCHVNIFSSERESSPKVREVGQIIRLRRFKFEISDKGELIAFERRAFSNWLIYSHDGEMVTSNAKREFPKNFNRELSSFEQGRLQDLRFWARTFLGRWTLKKVIWWNQYNPKTRKTTSVDLILKVTQIVDGGSQVRFVDEYCN